MQAVWLQIFIIKKCVKKKQMKNGFNNAQLNKSQLKNYYITITIAVTIKTIFDSLLY